MFGKQTQADEERAVAYREWLARRNPLAIASLVLGIFSLIEFGALIVPGVAGIVLGFVALKQIARTNMDGARLAWAGIALSVMSLCLAGWIYTMKPPPAATQTAYDPTCRHVSPFSLAQR
jgi:hypothetical protein